MLILLRTLRRLLQLALVAAAMGAVLLLAFGGRPRDLPWTPLDLSEAPGPFTGRKIAALTGDAAGCRVLLGKAGVRFTALPPLSAGGGRCGYQDGVRLLPGGSRSITLSPAGLGVSCPVAAALAVWEWNVVQPAAFEVYGRRVVKVEHFGSYSCRRLYGREAGAWSEHATADAIDVAGFTLEGGRRVTVARDWRGAGKDARFLRQVRDGACRLFSTVLSPDYNAAHRDHLHLDEAERGALGWRACR